jgi:hypothetical protein
MIRLWPPPGKPLAPRSLCNQLADYVYGTEAPFSNLGFVTEGFVTSAALPGLLAHFITYIRYLHYLSKETRVSFGAIF